MADNIRDRRIDNYFRTENIIVERKDLNIYEKMVYIVLCRYANNNDGAFPSYETIAKGASVCRDKAIKTVKSLIEKKLVEKEIRIDAIKGNKTNMYYVMSAEPIKEAVADNYPPSSCERPPLVVNDYHPSSCERPKEELYKKNYIKKNNKSVSLSIEEQTDELTNIIIQSGIDTFEDESFKEEVKEIITELYNDIYFIDTIRKVAIYHIDEAKRLYDERRQIITITNHKLYFKKCLVSAIKEAGLKGLNETWL